MAAAITDKFTGTFNSANPNVARVTVTRTSGATSLTCDNLAGWPTGTAVHFSTYKINTSNAVVAGTQIDWKGIVSGNTIGTLTRKAGATDSGSAIGDVVEMNPTGSWAQDVIDGITTQHNQDGTHGAVTATSVVSSGAVTGTTLTGTSLVNTGDVQLRSTSLETIASERFFDHVASGCVWTADAAGSTRLASMTAGVVYIGGKRVAVSAVTSRTFTASKDVYVDVDNTGTITYTDNTTNAASPALAANSIRLGIIVVGASSIATAASVNQGQEDRVLPIASSVPYAVTDSLGNLICPRDPNRKVLGYRQIVSNFTTSSTTAAQVTGISVPVIVPTGRKIHVSAYLPSIGVTTGTNWNTQLWDGTVASGTQLSSYQGKLGDSTFTTSAFLAQQSTPSSASKTYNLGLTCNPGTITAVATSTAPVWLRVELV